MMDDYKNFDNFQRTEGCKMISPHHSHPTNGVDPRILIAKNGLMAYRLHAQNREVL